MIFKNTSTYTYSGFSEYMYMEWFDNLGFDGFNEIQALKSEERDVREASRFQKALPLGSGAFFAVPLEEGQHQDIRFVSGTGLGGRVLRRVDHLLPNEQLAVQRKHFVTILENLNAILVPPVV